MTKLLLKAEFPLLIVSGILGQKLAGKLWASAFGEPVPDTAQQRVSVAKLIPAAIIEGTLYKLTRMGMDRGLRVAASRSEGSWIGSPGDGE